MNSQIWLLIQPQGLLCNKITDKSASPILPPPLPTLPLEIPTPGGSEELACLENSMERKEEMYHSAHPSLFLS